MRFSGKKSIPLRTDILIGILIILSAAATLLAMGRVPWCACGKILLWSSDIFSESNSQQISDPYSFTHFIHGIVFYALIWLIGRYWRWSFGIRLTLAIAIESIWEIVENTNAVIEFYRTATISLGYFGDSVINSVSDIAIMALGFLFASRFPIWVVILTLVIIEVLLMIFIRDNLTLNILMFIHPFESIKNWQLGV